MAKSKKSREDREEREEKDPKSLREPVARDGAYVMMLVMTLVAIIAGTVFMYLDFEEYGQKQPPAPQQVTIQKLGDKAPVEAITPKAGEPAPGPAGGMPMGAMP
jgi:hypothetical protein